MRSTNSLLFIEQNIGPCLMNSSRMLGCGRWRSDRWLCGLIRWHFPSVFGTFAAEEQKRRSRRKLDEESKERRFDDNLVCRGQDGEHFKDKQVSVTLSTFYT